MNNEKNINHSNNGEHSGQNNSQHEDNGHHGNGNGKPFHGGKTGALVIG